MTICLITLAMSALASGGSAPPLYSTFELVLHPSEAVEHPFLVFAEATFTDETRSFGVDGFYDGQDTWRVRFMPDRLGTWRYSWDLCGAKGEGEFTVVDAAQPLNHGHVHRDARYPRCLVCDDGTPHYWFGGKWIAATDYLPVDGAGVPNGDAENEPIPDETFLAYFDVVQQKGHNGLLLKTALFPLLDDGIGWDLDWIQRAEWCVREMGKRGIYCQVNLFDTWSRKRGERSAYTTNGADHVLNVWAPGDEQAKRNYLRTLVARFAAFPNVYWELGNEMEHAPNPGADFVREANEKYLPWLREFDPYGLPVGVSESGVWTKASVDIGFMHQTHTFPEAGGPYDRPTIMNELVFGWEPANLYEDEAIRDPENRFGYRRTFWRMFCSGGSGCSEATWLDLRHPLNEAVEVVMEDHRCLRVFIETLPVNINEMRTEPSFVKRGPGLGTTRAKAGELYVTYFQLAPGFLSPAGEACVVPRPGDYEVLWVDPKTGVTTMSRPVRADGDTAIAHEAIHEDTVLLLRARDQ